jgi:hypothetical protein
MCFLEVNMEAHDLYSSKKVEVDYICDLCERKTLYEFINETQEQVSLCTACHKHLKPMPDGIIKTSVIRFLMKNVI